MHDTLTGEHRRLGPRQGVGAEPTIEVWSLDLVANDRSLGIVIELGFRPAQGTGWFWFMVAGPDRDLIALVDDEIKIPAGDSLEVRAPGLWTELYAQVPFDHYTVDLEAFGVELDDPTDVLGAGYGKRVAMGAELEWDTLGQVIELDQGYEIPCTVHGELLIDDATIELTARGWRSHSWSGDRVHLGMRGFDENGPVRHPEIVGSPETTGPPESVAFAPTPVGVEHHLVIDPAVAGWWRGGTGL